MRKCILDPNTGTGRALVVTAARALVAGGLPASRRRDHALACCAAPYGAQALAKSDGGFLERPVLPIGAKECKGKWCFQTSLWRDACFETIELKKSFRTGDPTLINALHELRRGHKSHPAVFQLVDETKRKLQAIDGIKPTVLYPMPR